MTKTQQSKAVAVAYSYLRFSHPTQAKGDSVRRQTAKRDNWLKRNRVPLDTSLTLEDKGVSGFTGEHRTNPDRHALAAFLELVKQGRIAKGSYLIVESLDRLSREDIRPALTLLLNLIDAGVRVVQLSPVEMVYDDSVDPMTLMMAIMELSRGNSESKMKSERVGGAWREKKRRAAAERLPLTARTPAWLRLTRGKWEVIEEAAETVQQIVRWAVEGRGLGGITKRLNAAGVPPIGRADYWARSYIAKILSNPALIGQYQPYAGRGRKRRTEGDPIPGYFPAIVSEQDFFAARAGLASRRTKAGRIGKAGVNLFANLLRDAHDGGTLHLVNKGKKSCGKTLVSYRAAQGTRDGRYASFPFAVFEREILARLREIDPRDVLPRKDRAGNLVLALSGKLQTVQDQKARIKAKLVSNPESDDLADVVVSLELKAKAIAEELAQAKQEAASPAMEAWGQCRSLIDALDNAPDPEEMRVRLRAAIRRIVDSVWVLTFARGAIRLAAVQIWFSHGNRHRDYLILHRPALGGAVGERPAYTDTRDFAKAFKPGDLDLRDRKDAARLEKALAAVDLEAVAGRP
jgi:DNA invertase Pin-like site-specific DNA recombinase